LVVGPQSSVLIFGFRESFVARQGCAPSHPASQFHLISRTKRRRRRRFSLLRFTFTIKLAQHFLHSFAEIGRRMHLVRGPLQNRYEVLNGIRKVRPGKREIFEVEEVLTLRRRRQVGWNLLTESRRRPQKYHDVGRL